jgi:methylmalonyl-CoA mutase N-terminal domain/subunit
MTERHTQSRIPLKPVYGPADLDGGDAGEKLGEPGAYPYTRGARAHPEERGGWIQRELSGEGDPARSNAQFKYLLSKGQTGLDVIGDTPTMGCLDPDHPFAQHAVGTQGVSLCCLEDYRELYRDLPLDRITLSHSLQPAFALAALHCVARERGISPAVLRGSVVQPPYYCEDTGYAVHMPFESTCPSSSGCACPWTRSRSAATRCRSSTPFSRTPITSATAAWMRSRRWRSASSRSAASCARS